MVNKTIACSKQKENWPIDHLFLLSSSNAVLLLSRPICVPKGYFPRLFTALTKGTNPKNLSSR